MSQAHAFWQTSIPTPDQQARQAAAEYQNQLTKPPGSLGRLEQIAIDFAGFQRCERPVLTHPMCRVFAADHGILAQGVSAFPQAVTVEMIKNFVAGGAAISVLARQHNFDLTVVNCGTANDAALADIAGQLEQASVAAGTADFSQQPAMTQAQAQQALSLGAEQAEKLQAQGCDLLLAGEMGIGNTSSATAMAALLLARDCADLVGPGTGLQGEGLSHKQQVLTAAVERARPAVHSAFDVLVEVGGFEIGAIAGAYLRAAQLGVPSLVDGFITTAAALLAVKLNPEVRSWLLFSHQSAEPGHRLMLAALDAEPLLSLNMRLGEGSGAAAALPIIQQALALHNQMATFAQAAVSSANEASGQS